MDEFGESPSIYIWPVDHVEGEPFEDDFWERVAEGLKSVYIEWERI